MFIFIVHSLDKRFELNIQVDAKESAGSHQEHTENRYNRWVNLTDRRHIESNHDNDHTENNEQEGQNRLCCHLAFERERGFRHG